MTRFRAPPLIWPVDSPQPDQEAWFEEHVRPHEAMLRAWLVHNFGSRLSVDDIVQDSFIRVLGAQAVGELRAPKAFLFATARNLALDHFRRHHISRTGPLVEADHSNVLDEDADTPDTVARDEERALLTEAIQSLPERCRRIMTLRIVYGLTQRAIGEKLGISDRTVATQLALGTTKCSDFIIRRLGERRPPP